MYLDGSEIVYYPDENDANHGYRMVAINIDKIISDEDLSDLYSNAGNSITDKFLTTYSNKIDEWNNDSVIDVGIIQINGKSTAVASSNDGTYDFTRYIMNVTDDTLLVVYAIRSEGEPDSTVSDLMATLATVEAE